MADYQFTVSLNTFDASLLPPGSPAKGTAGYSATVHKFLQEQFAGFKGDARIVVSEDSILVEWTPSPAEPDPLKAAVARLEKGEVVPAIVMLELLRQRHPHDFRLLYNLGLAYSNLGRSGEAMPLLAEAVQRDPNDVNARIALGVAYAKEDRNQEAVEILEKAVADAPNNPLAQRNLGACLVAVNEVGRGIKCLLRATELNPKDQQAFWGLAEAYRAAGNLDDADPTYQKVVAIDEFSQLAQQAKEQLSWLAHVGFLMRGGGVGRSDAVMYCLAALKQFDGLPEEEVQKVVFEIAMLGTKGFEINDTAEKYQLRSMPGNFSGLHLLCIMYTGFQQIAPELPPLFDLAKEYAVAKKMFEDTRGEK